jgi:hypothetical protein
MVGFGVENYSEVAWNAAIRERERAFVPLALSLSLAISENLPQNATKIVMNGRIK